MSTPTTKGKANTAVPKAATNTTTTTTTTTTTADTDTVPFTNLELTVLSVTPARPARAGRARSKQRQVLENLEIGQFVNTHVSGLGDTGKKQLASIRQMTQQIRTDWKEDGREISFTVYPAGTPTPEESAAGIKEGHIIVGRVEPRASKGQDSDQS